MRRFSDIARKGKLYCLVLLSAILTISSCRKPKDLVYQDIENFSIKQAGFDKTLLAMDIRLYNPNKYSLKLINADVDVFLNGNHLGKMNVNGHCELSGLDTASIPITLEVDLKNALPNVLQLILNPEVDVKITGTIKAGRHGIYINIPISYEGKQDILSGIKM